MATRARRMATEKDRELGPDDALDGEDVLPGFRCTLGEIL